MASLPWSKKLIADLDQRKAVGRYRQQRTRFGEQGIDVVIDGKKLLSFCSNDYLGLASHSDLKKAFIDAVDKEGVGSGAAHLLTGHSHYHQELEELIAHWTGREAALLFSTGYMANMGVIQALLGKEDAVFQDKWNHASLLDADLVCCSVYLEQLQPASCPSYPQRRDT